jgi:hypothetical protein
MLFFLLKLYNCWRERQTNITSSTWRTAFDKFSNSNAKYYSQTEHLAVDLLIKSLWFSRAGSFSNSIHQRNTNGLEMHLEMNLGNNGKCATGTTASHASDGTYKD